MAFCRTFIYNIYIFHILIWLLGERETERGRERVEDRTSTFSAYNSNSRQKRERWQQQNLKEINHFCHIRLAICICNSTNIRAKYGHKIACEYQKKHKKNYCWLRLLKKVMKCSRCCRSFKKNFLFVLEICGK